VEKAMNSSAAQSSLLATLFSLARIKFQMRWMVVIRGITAAVFWAAFAIAGSWLKHFGYGQVAIALVAIWLVLALPMLYFQLSLIVDMLGYVFRGKISFYPLIQASTLATSEAEREALQRAMLPPMLDVAPTKPRATTPASDRFWAVLVPFLGFTSPLACFSTWALIVLVRIPDSAHQRVMSAKKVNTIQLEAERQVYTETLARLSIK
jgi:hypothetical protein